MVGEAILEMEPEKKRQWPISARYVAIDETEYWCLEPEDMELIERIETVYVYDKNISVYCCEITPSREFWPCETRVIFKDFVYEDKTGKYEIDKDRIEMKVMGCSDWEVRYYHVYRADEMPGKDVGETGISFDDVSYVDQMDSLAQAQRESDVI